MFLLCYPFANHIEYPANKSYILAFNSHDRFFSTFDNNSFQCIQSDYLTIFHPKRKDKGGMQGSRITIEYSIAFKLE
jgi:hypothetical protein